MIGTKLHILQESTSLDDKVAASSHPVIARMLSAANYVASAEVLELLKRGDVSSSINALVTAEIARLPHSPMVMEFTLAEDMHNFVMLEETENPDTILTWYAGFLGKDGRGIAYPTPLRFQIMTEGFIVNDFPKQHELAEIMVPACSIALALSLLMLNTKGIEKRVVEYHKLNKKRMRRNRPPVPRHTVLHIGTIYRRDGTSERYKEGTHHKIMHWRSGYTRRQHYGKGNAETRMVFIPPCIVNFQPDEDVPMPRRVVKV